MSGTRYTSHGASRRGTGFYTSIVLPTWIKVSGAFVPIMDLDFVNDRAWLGNTASDIATVLPDARLELEGVLVESGEPDDLIINISSILGFDQTQFSIVTEAVCAADHAGNYALWGIQANANNRYTQFRTNVPRITGFAAISGTPTLEGLDNATAVADGSAIKTAWAVAANSMAFSVKGAAVVTDTSGAMPTAMTTLAVGRDHETAYWESHIGRLTLFNVRLANAALVALAT